MLLSVKCFEHFFEHSPNELAMRLNWYKKILQENQIWRESAYKQGVAKKRWPSLKIWLMWITFIREQKNM